VSNSALWCCINNAVENSNRASQLIPSGLSGNIVPTRSVTMSHIKIGGGSNKEIKDLSPLKDEIGGSPRFLDTPGEESPGTRSKKVSIVSP
jgi:hypothetical protein